MCNTIISCKEEVVNDTKVHEQVCARKQNKDSKLQVKENSLNIQEKDLKRSSHFKNHVHSAG